tara:strand:+ start:14751 stop:15374 length:624 start_codon:yes stop_codon:yes gene_type:complete
MKIHCKYDELVNVLEVKPNPKNPNTHPPKQIKLLAKILKQNGWRQSIVVSKNSGYIVKGHGRLIAAKKAGFDKVPVEYQDYKSKEEENADLLADNKLSEFSKTDQNLISSLLAEYDEDFDLSITGYDRKDILLNSVDLIHLDEPEYEVVPVMDEAKSCFVIVCDTIEEKEKISEIVGFSDMISYKTDKVAPSSVIKASQVLERLKKG